MRGVQARAGPSLWELTERIAANLEVPDLDHDRRRGRPPVSNPGLLMKAHESRPPALVVFPNTGHAVKPRGARIVQPQLRRVSSIKSRAGRWPRRDPRSVTGSILGRAVSSEPEFTIGIEEEYFLVDPARRAMVVSDPPPAMLAECEALLAGQVSPEFLLRSQIEVGTRVCATLGEAHADFAAAAGRR